MRVFKVRHFARFARNEGIADSALAEAIRQAESGLINASLGGEVIKMRVARPGEGKRGGYRTIIAYRTREAAIFLIGFPKNKRDNISSSELELLKATASSLLSHSDDEFDTEVEKGKLLEIEYV